MSRRVVFSHGKESGPWGTKISALAEVARSLGWEADSVDYRGLDDPAARVERLRTYEPDHDGPWVFVGSSMGGHVCTACSIDPRVVGLFLMAPAFYMPGFEAVTPVPADCPITIVHGWRDDIVPVDHSIRFAREYAATLHVLDTDHRMIDRLDEIGRYFAGFLQALESVGTREVTRS
jgi:pimeloyl-ACP methyl ester carboxylesterase